MSNFRAIEWLAWETWFPIISFVLIAGVFTAIVVRALLMPQQKIDQMANLPLESDDEGLERIEREDRAVEKMNQKENRP